MKFVHIADMHLDMPFIPLRGSKELIKKKKMEQKFVLKKVFDYVQSNKVEILLIAGDVFEQNYVTEDTIQYLIANFKKLKDTKIFIAPGNHDPLIKNSAYLTYEWPDNVFIFGGEVGCIEVNNVNIYGIGFTDFYMVSDAIEKIEVDEEKTNILITHGTLNGANKRYHDISKKSLTKFDYVALGHIHQPKVDDSKIIYSGSLTACGFDEEGPHGMVVGEINGNNTGKAGIDYKFVPMGEIEFANKEVDISNINSKQELIDVLNIKENVIYSIVLTGTRNISTEEVVDDLKSSFVNVYEVIDKSHIKFNLEEIAKEESLKGIFTKKMLESIKENPQEEELYYDAIECVYKAMKG